MTLNQQKALVLFSGGQDSAVCLAWALDRYEQVETVAFEYGQRHVVELDCCSRVRERMKKTFPLWGERLGKDHLIDISALSEINTSALTSDSEIRKTSSGLPNTFVPGRNIVFFSLAGAIALGREAKYLVGGMCETDFSGYPDCRDDSIKAMQVALNMGMDARFVIETPLMWVDKSGTWALAKELGGEALVELILEESHTCYLGDRSVRHFWGYGCGQCPACLLRKVGYEKFSDG
jgi:7-cyano-7-deazaguanine synthase